MESPVKGAICLAQSDYHIQFRLGIGGKPKTGKTHAATTFPNPVFLSLDRGLVSHIGNPNIWEVPFWDGRFCDSIVKRNGIQTLPNRKDAIVKWLNEEAVKLGVDKTLVIDGNTGLQSAYHQQYDLNPIITKNGEVDSFAEWKYKLSYFTEVMMCLKALQCDVIYICHEQDDRDKKGELNGNIRPLLSGSFVDELQSHFTDWFRSLVINKPTSPEGSERLMKDFVIDKVTLQEWIQSTPNDGPKKCPSIYLWQTQGDTKQTGIGTSLIGAPKYITASYNSIKKYQKKQETNE